MKDLLFKVAVYLQEHYYSKYAGIMPEMVPDNQTLIRALNLHNDKVVVVCDGDEIKGVAVFLTLSDETFKKIDTFNLVDVGVLGKLLHEKGPNLHFIVLTAKNFEVIRKGIRKVKKLNPKTISWWNPDMSKLHKYTLN